MPYRCRIFRKHPQHRGKISDVPVDDAEERDDRSLIRGDAVEVAHAVLRRMSLDEKTPPRLDGVKFGRRRHVANVPRDRLMPRFAVPEVAAFIKYRKERQRQSGNVLVSRSVPIGRRVLAPFHPA